MTESKVTRKTLKKQEERRASSMKKQEQRKAPSCPPSQPSSRKQSRKVENPVRVQTAPGQSSDFQFLNSWICKNPACTAKLSMDDTFCKRCSCCICHLFDDNKDPTLWLACACESDEDDSCGLSCHIECALQHNKVGVVDLGQLMQLDGSYCCASCGKVSGILGCWKKQLIAAKEARRVDVLCYRVNLSYRLFEGTSRFKEMHEIIKDAKAKLEAEVGPVDGLSSKMARGIVSRLSVAVDVQKLCSIAIEKADKWLTRIGGGDQAYHDSLPAACRFLFEEVKSSSAIIVLLEPSKSSSDDIKGYKFWYCKTREETFTKVPGCVFPRAQRRILISNLQPCTEYTFRIVSFSEASDLGHFEAKCFTKSVETIGKKPKSAAPTLHKGKILKEGCSSSENREAGTATADYSGFRVQKLGKILHLAQAQEQGSPEVSNCVYTDKCRNVEEVIKSEPMDRLPSASHRLDLNIASVPDLNEELTESSKDEDNGCSLEQAVEADHGAASHGIDNNGVAKSDGSSDSQTWTPEPVGEVPAPHSEAEFCKKRAASTNEDPHDCDSTLINGSPFKMSTTVDSLDENFEYCVKIIRWLECEGHINQEFRLKLLTWFSIRSTEQERRVVNTFIGTLIDDPVSLAGQLVDSFSDVICSKRPRNGFCSRLWH